MVQLLMLQLAKHVTVNMAKLEEIMQRVGKTPLLDHVSLLLQRFINGSVCFLCILF